MADNKKTHNAPPMPAARLEAIRHTQPGAAFTVRCPRTPKNLRKRGPKVYHCEVCGWGTQHPRQLVYDWMGRPVIRCKRCADAKRFYNGDDNATALAKFGVGLITIPEEFRNRLRPGV